MFSFHKPKIYRSNLGCCICKAKSSSSRFTDSRKYENEFERCFRIEEKRSGEICNACVLLVKRWKKLSPENRLTKHWHHVVDARAGPGTKLIGNRRITSNNSSHNQHDASNVSNNQSCRAQKSHKSESLPLCSSNQSNNRASSSPSHGSTRGRASSLSKARAIDTNVSTFTFGEPSVSAYRRNFMTIESSSSYNPTYSHLTKPQSALNSNAFELVIKRFRQRQQQQHLEAQRRLLNRQERQKTRQSLSNSWRDDRTTLPKLSGNNLEECSSQTNDTNSRTMIPMKRVKRLSENHSSFVNNIESLKVLSVLDSSIWRKEKICCGVIFRGLHNEVAIFPKLLRPCECRLRNSSSTERINAKDEKSVSQEDEIDIDDENYLLKKSDQDNNSPPPRTTKSGSISSCDSNTSGTGSIEPTLDEIKRSNRNKKDPSPAVRPNTISKKRRLQSAAKDDAESNSTSGASTSSQSKDCSANSPSCSDNSSSGMVLIDGCELEELENEDGVDEHELVLAEDDGCESGNDTSSSAESLIELEQKKSSAVV